jgi:hypothetical protein
LSIANRTVKKSLNHWVRRRENISLGVSPPIDLINHVAVFSAGQAGNQKSDVMLLAIIASRAPLSITAFSFDKLI